MGQQKISKTTDSTLIIDKTGLAIFLNTSQIYNIDSILPDFKNDNKIIRQIVNKKIGKYDFIEICKTKRKTIISEIEKEIINSKKMIGEIIYFNIDSVNINDKIKKAFELKTGKDSFIK